MCKPKKKTRLLEFIRVPIKIIVFLLLRVNKENLNAGYVYFHFHCVLKHKLLLTISSDRLHKTYRSPSLCLQPVWQHYQINFCWLPFLDCGRNCWRHACVRTDSPNVFLNFFFLPFPSFSIRSSFSSSANGSKKWLEQTTQKQTVDQQHS